MKNKPRIKEEDLGRRSQELLVLVAESTKRGQDGTLQQYFVPKAKPMWCDALRRALDVSGSGDASSLRALERRGLVERIGAAPHSYAATDYGVCAAELYASVLPLRP
jgi:hypothetical protein